MSLEQVSTSYGQYTVPDSEEMINLGVGQPRNSCLNNPLVLMKKYMEQYSKEFLPDDVLQYGDIPGYKSFRFVLSAFLKKYNYDSKCTADNFFQTNGANEAVSLITTILTNHDDIIKYLENEDIINKKEKINPLESPASLYYSNIF